MPRDRSVRKSMSLAFTARHRFNPGSLCNPALQSKGAFGPVSAAAVSARPERAQSLVRGHEDRQPKTGEVMQRLVDADQGPEPGMLRRHAEGRGAQPLGAIDRDVD